MSTIIALAYDDSIANIGITLTVKSIYTPADPFF